MYSGYWVWENTMFGYLKNHLAYSMDHNQWLLHGQFPARETFGANAGDEINPYLENSFLL